MAWFVPVEFRTLRECRLALGDIASRVCGQAGCVTRVVSAVGCWSAAAATEDPRTRAGAGDVLR